MGLLLGLGIPLVYLMIMGGLMPVFYKNIRSHCDRCQNPHPYLGRCYADHESAAFFQSLFWFVGLPAYLSAKQLAGPSRAEKRRAKELAEAKHKAELAELQAKETRNLEIANGIITASPEKVEAARRALGEEYSYGGHVEDDVLDMVLEAEKKRAQRRNR